MKSGDLKDRVELYTISSTSDGEGGTTTPVYTKISDRWAKVSQLSESEINRSGLTVGERTYRITLSRSLNESMSKSIQIRWNGLRLNVNSIVTNDFWIYITATNKE